MKIITLITAAMILTGCVSAHAPSYATTPTYVDQNDVTKCAAIGWIATLKAQQQNNPGGADMMMDIWRDAMQLSDDPAMSKMASDLLVGEFFKLPADGPQQKALSNVYALSCVAIGVL
jgi:PBP1b-binding outer membrane lipoprotein LpoB